MTQVPPLLTPRQAAERLTAAGVTVTEDTIRRWVRDRRVPAITLPSGYYRLRAADVDAILNSDHPDDAPAESTVSAS